MGFVFGKIVVVPKKISIRCQIDQNFTEILGLKTWDWGGGYKKISVKEQMDTFVIKEQKFT